MHAMPWAGESWPALGTTIRHNAQWICQQRKALSRLNCTHMLAADEGRRVDAKLPKLGHTHLGMTQKVIGQDTKGIWTRHSRQLGRTQKGFEQDTEGILA